jgi:hypothetical protein
MRDLILVTLLCALAAVVADHVWLGGKYFGLYTHRVAQEFSSSNRR